MVSTRACGALSQGSNPCRHPRNMENIWDNDELVSVLANGGLAVMPTDTLYGVVCSALSAETVNRLYDLRRKTPNKPILILIESVNDLGKFSVVPTDEQRDELNKNWPGPVTIILDCSDPKLEYLHRGTNSLAFRVPAVKEIRDLLLKTGPLLAPSANTEAMPPAKNTAEAKEYFGDSVDFYLDGGDREGKASRIIKLSPTAEVSVIRE
jgi:L-threonylcarbamoyladenylate synthase